MNLKSLEKILIIRLSSLGDILLTTPIIRSLKNSYPNLKINFLLRQKYNDVLTQNPYLSKIFFYESGNESYQNLLDSLKQENFDLIIDLQNNLRSYKIRKKLKVPSYQFHKRSFDKFLLVNFKINHLKNAPQIPVRYAKTIANLSLDENSLDLISDKLPSDKLNENKNLIGFAPGSRHFTKMWPKEYFAQLGNKLVDKGFTIVLMGGTDDIQICNEISLGIKDSINLCNNNDLLQTAADMSKMKLLVCNDSGMMHVASSAKVPVAVIFGSSVKEFGFAPYKNKNLILENKLLSCRPCSHIGRERCPKGHFKCMLKITPESVFDEIIRFMDFK